MRFTALYVGLILITIDQTTSFSRIPLHGATRSASSDGGLGVLPPWSEFATIAAQLSIVTPAVIQMYYFKKQIDVLGDKFEKLESAKSQSLETTAKEGSIVEGFTKDMKEALAAYKELYGSMSEQIDTILTNEEKRLTFEGDLVDSISELQGLSTDVSELKIENKALRNILESASQSQKASTDNIKKQQIEQAKAIDQAQKVNARERAAMRRDIQKEQVLAVGAVSKSVGSLKSEIDLLSEKESKRNEQLMAGVSVRTLDPEIVRSLNIDPRLISELQEKVTSLEIKANNLEELSTSMLAGSESKKENVNASKNIFEEVKVLNEKITKLEKQNVEKVSILKNKNKEVFAEDVIEAITQKEELQNLQVEVKGLKIVFNNIEKLEKNTITLERQGQETAKSIVNLNVKITAIDEKNKEMMSTALEAPSSVEVLNVAVKGFSERLNSLESAGDALKEARDADQMKMEELNKGITLVAELSSKSEQHNARMTKQIEEWKVKQENYINYKTKMEKESSQYLKDLDFALNQKMELKSNQMEEAVAKFASFKNQYESDFTSLKGAIVSANEDFSDSLERLDGSQIAEAEKTKAALKKMEGDMGEQLASLDLKKEEIMARFNEFSGKSLQTLADLELKSQESVKTNSASIEKLSAETETKISQINGNLRDSITTAVAEEIGKVSKPLFMKVEGDLVSLRSDIDEDLNASEKQANHRMNSFEKQLTLSNRRLEKEVSSNSEFLKGTVDLRITDMQKDLKANSVEIEEKLKSLDESVEQRAEQVVTQKSFFFQVKKVARGAAGKVSRGAGRVGRGVKGLAKGGFSLIKSLARGPDDVPPPPNTRPPVRSANRMPLSVSTRAYSNAVDIIDGDFDDSDILQ